MMNVLVPVCIVSHLHLHFLLMISAKFHKLGHLMIFCSFKEMAVC